MEVLFLQDWLNPATNKIIYKGRRVHIMKKKALELIADGIAQEVLPFGVEQVIEAETKKEKKKNRKRIF
jgi:hypothetical protein